jgi:CRP/FNR family cyclic AMP-dependent transcriptional regulator
MAAATLPVVIGHTTFGRTAILRLMDSTTGSRAPDSTAGPLAPAFRDGRRIRLRVGQVLLTEGDASSRVVLVLSGRVKISTFSDQGQETVLAFRGAGDVLGDLAAIDGEDHMATVMVVEEGEALVVPAAAFLNALETEPGLAVVLLRSVIGRLRNADRMRAEYVALDVTGRVARRLIDLAQTYGEPADGGIRIGLQLSQRELAGWVGASREAVNKSIAQLEARGLLARDHGVLIVRDVEGLRRRAS